MALPIIPFLAKIITLKFLKGAAIGFGRYAIRLSKKENFDENGNPLEGSKKLSHIITKETVAKDNLIYLMLMLGNFFFGLQELILWLWNVYAKQTKYFFNTGVPSGLETPNVFCIRVDQFTWPKIWLEYGRWLSIASLIYWPKITLEDTKIKATDSPNWFEILYSRNILLVCSDVSGKYCYKAIEIEVLKNSLITIHSTVDRHLITEIDISTQV